MANISEGASSAGAVSQEAVGKAFSAAAMMHARDRSWAAVRRIAATVRPGMSQQHGTELALEVLQDMGVERNWHAVKMRFGAETLKTFHDPTDHGSILGENDIFYIDIGPVWQGHEGDVGDTFVLGDDAGMKACAAAARELWHEVAGHWRQTAATGRNLYAYAGARARALGWRLNLGVKGHRVSDFPHAIYKAGRLADFAQCPSVGLWILEIQLAHPSRPFGAFYEDILIG